MSQPQLSLIWDSMAPENTDRAKKLEGDVLKVYRVLADGRPHLIADIAKSCDIPENSAQAHCRHLRKEKMGRLNVQCKSLADGLNYYILLPGFYESKRKKNVDNDNSDE